jgi:dynein heavy chain
VLNGLDTQHIGEMKEEWLKNILSQIPPHLKQLDAVVKILSSEIREDYHMSVKKAIGMYL